MSLPTQYRKALKSKFCFGNLAVFSHTISQKKPINNLLREVSLVSLTAAHKVSSTIPLNPFIKKFRLLMAPLLSLGESIHSSKKQETMIGGIHQNILSQHRCGATSREQLRIRGMTRTHSSKGQPLPTLRPIFVSAGMTW